LEAHPVIYNKFKEIVDSKLCVSNELDANNVDPEIEDAQNAGIRLTAGGTAAEKAEIAELAQEALNAASEMGMEAPAEAE
jgi:hypothetical protein